MEMCWVWCCVYHGWCLGGCLAKMVLGGGAKSLGVGSVGAKGLC